MCLFFIWVVNDPTRSEQMTDICLDQVGSFHAWSPWHEKGFRLFYICICCQREKVKRFISTRKTCNQGDSNIHAVSSLYVSCDFAWMHPPFDMASHFSMCDAVAEYCRIQYTKRSLAWTLLQTGSFYHGRCWCTVLFSYLFESVFVSVGVRKRFKKTQKSKNTNCAKPWIHWAARLSGVHLFQQQNTKPPGAMLLRAFSLFIAAQDLNDYSCAKRCNLLIC